MSYIHIQNRNTFTLRYKKYKRLQADIWGNIWRFGKSNKFTRIMAEYAKSDIRRKVYDLVSSRRYAHHKLYKDLQLRRKWNIFHWTILDKPKPKRNRPVQEARSLFYYNKRLTLFYFCRQRRTALRKLYRLKRAPRRNLGYNLYFPKNANNSIRIVRSSEGIENIGTKLEARIDLLLYRLNFISTVFEGRRFIREKRAFVLRPCERKRSYRKFFTYYKLYRYFHKVPLYHFITLRYDMALKRKMILMHMLKSKRWLAYPPNYLMVNYRTLMGFRIFPPKLTQIRYPFPGNFALFMGLARYY